MALTIIATYDVADDARRARLAALLQSVGDRVQKSVFVLFVADKELEALRRRAGEIIDPADDSLYLMRRCASCWQGLECLGQADPPGDVLYWAAL